MVTWFTFGLKRGQVVLPIPNFDYFWSRHRFNLVLKASIVILGYHRSMSMIRVGSLLSCKWTVSQVKSQIFTAWGWSTWAFCTHQRIKSERLSSDKWICHRCLHRHRCLYSSSALPSYQLQQVNIMGSKRLRSVAFVSLRCMLNYKLFNNLFF